mgnify:CR=1 FL=1
MSKRILDRRQFLKSAATTAAVVAAAGGTTTILASNQSWAMDLNVLGQHEAEVLLKMTRALYPHDRFGDVYYAEVVEALDEKAKADGSIVELVKDGVAQLDGALGVPFLELSPGTQTEVLKTMETTPFFQTVRGSLTDDGLLRTDRDGTGWQWPKGQPRPLCNKGFPRSWRIGALANMSVVPL